MRRSILTTGLAVALGFAVAGCDEMQYEDAVGDYNEDVSESAGEVAEQKGDLIESKTDDL